MQSSENTRTQEMKEKILKMQEEVMWRAALLELALDTSYNGRRAFGDNQMIVSFKIITGAKIEITIDNNGNILDYKAKDIVQSDFTVKSNTSI
jgi:hypothetical protein